MNQYFINGNKVAVEYAKHRFVGFQQRVYGVTDSAEIDAMWEQCQHSEEARDDWLPDNLEIIQA